MTEGASPGRTQKTRRQGPGASEEVKKSSGAGEVAIVMDQLPSAAYRLKLENEDLVIAHAAGAGVRNFERLRPGDKVRVELSPYDRTRGRIVELLR